jgi:molybdenum cofactor cytidylyltransferase
MITALVLAAGESKRMGQPKMLMPWGNSTVFGTIIETLHTADIDDIVVVTGALHKKLESVYDKELCFVHNEQYANGEMLTSIQVGLRSITRKDGAVLVVLGDQPQLQAGTIRLITDRYQQTHHSIIVPSFNMHRGHPWLIDHTCWEEILNLLPPETLRTYLALKHEIIDYIIVNTPTILQDLDTPEDYTHYRPD